MYQFYKRALLKLFDDLNELKRNSSNINLCFSIQERVIDNVRRIEAKVRRLKKENNLLINQVKNSRLPREITTQLKQKIKRNDYKKGFYDNLLLIYRDIGDGIAFIYLNKWDIKPLAVAKEHAGFISGKKGIRLELKTFRYCKMKGVVCIFNDITNSLRHGDLTLPVAGKPQLLELKSGKSSKKNDRAQRQNERANNILKYINEDIGRNVYPVQGDQVMYRRELANKEKNYQKRVTNLLVRAVSKNENITAKIENGLYYIILTNDDETMEKELEKLPKDFLPVMIFVNNLKKIKQGYLPFSLIIGDANALFEFYSGQCSIAVFLDANLIQAELTNSGFEVEFLNDPEYFLQLKQPQNDLLVKISNHFFGRVAGEFLSLNWLIKEMGARLETYKQQFT